MGMGHSPLSCIPGLLRACSNASSSLALRRLLPTHSQSPYHPRRRRALKRFGPACSSGFVWPLRVLPVPRFVTPSSILGKREMDLVSFYRSGGSEDDSFENEKRGLQNLLGGLVPVVENQPFARTTFKPTMEHGLRQLTLSVVSIL